MTCCRIRWCALAALSFLPSLALAQDAPARRQGTIYKGEVDVLIDLLRDTSRAGSHAPAAKGVLGGDVLSTAQVLVAMGHCHRRYHVSDGPVVRPSIDYLLRGRQQDGSFGDAAATRWVIDALEVMDRSNYREEVAAARRWLAGKAEAGSPFDAQVAQILDAVRADRFPQHLADEAAQRARAFQREPATLDREVAAAALVALVACQVANRSLDAAQQQAGGDTWQPTQQRAFDWLLAHQQDGVFGKGGDPALTGFGLMALQTKPKSLRSANEQAAIDAGARWLLGQQHDDGTFGDHEVNYTTCVAVGALSRWGDPAAAPALQKAQRAILGFQNIEQAGYQRGDRDYGSIGYGGSQRGDLSNTHFALEALRATGLPQDHEALKKAIVFLQRTQNLKAVNDFAGEVPDPERDDVILDATSGDDGGAVYYPGNSAAGYVVQPDGKAVARSYGTMTYSLLKAYTLAGVPAGDARVQAAVGWMQRNWTLERNPGADPALGEKAAFQGLFYYYMVLAQALDVAGVEALTVDGAAVDWRRALRAQLEGSQLADGSWLNEKNGRWMESVPLLCTCYALVALEHCR